MNPQEKALKAYSAAREPVSLRLRYARMAAVYDAAIEACTSSDMNRLDDALQLLERTLNYTEVPELAMSLSGLYASARYMAGTGDYSGAQHILTTLRDTWTERGQRELGAGIDFPVRQQS